MAAGIPVFPPPTTTISASPSHFLGIFELVTRVPPFYI
jgi:hypothetical protein